MVFTRSQRLGSNSVLSDPPSLTHPRQQSWLEGVRPRTLGIWMIKQANEHLNGLGCKCLFHVWSTQAHLHRKPNYEARGPFVSVRSSTFCGLHSYLGLSSAVRRQREAWLFLRAEGGKAGQGCLWVPRGTLRGHRVPPLASMAALAPPLPLRQVGRTSSEMTSFWNRAWPLAGLQ